jgi:hypothetical protein
MAFGSMTISAESAAISGRLRSFSLNTECMIQLTENEQTNGGKRKEEGEMKMTHRPSSSSSSSSDRFRRAAGRWLCGYA